MFHSVDYCRSISLYRNTEICLSIGYSVLSYCRWARSVSVLFYYTATIDKRQGGVGKSTTDLFEDVWYFECHDSVFVVTQYVRSSVNKEAMSSRSRTSFWPCGVGTAVCSVTGQKSLGKCSHASIILLFVASDGGCYRSCCFGTKVSYDISPFYGIRCNIFVEN